MRITLKTFFHIYSTHHNKVNFINYRKWYYLVPGFNTFKFNITLSKYKADFIKRWDELKEFEQSKEPVQGKIVKRVKGGLVVDLGVIQAFLPGSQADVQPIKNFDDF